MMHASKYQTVWAAIALILLATVQSVSAFYIPGFTAVSYKFGQQVQLDVNKIFSKNAQLPYAYSELDFVCQPKGPVKRTWLNLGEILRGDRFVSSDFQLQMKQDIGCQQLCTKALSGAQASNAKQLIEEEYSVEWIVDNLPGATAKTEISEGGRKMYVAGFPLGRVKDGKTYIHNHFTLVFLYEKNEKKPDEQYIVGFEVYPESYDGTDCPVDVDHPMQEIGESDVIVRYTYAVTWQETEEIKWTHRWDMYMTTSDPQIHWFAIINSFIILIFITSMVAVIIMRTLNRDISMYNEEDIEGAEEDSTGWKLVHGDVFRAPKHANLLAPVIGSGIQCLVMMTMSLALSSFGVLNPSYRGGTMSNALFFYAFGGLFSGYASTRLYIMLQGSSWRRNALVTATLLPAAMFSLMFILNCFVWAKHSSSAIPFGTFFALFAIYLFIALPLVFIGSSVASRQKPIEHPVRIHQIPRQIPEQIWYLSPNVSILTGGMMPFAVVFVELFFIFKGIWSNQYTYFIVGFLAIVFLILVATAAEISIVVVYLQLQAEDYRWYWRAFLVSAASGIYIFIYSVFYYFSRLEVTGFVPALVYFVYSLLMCGIYSLCVGSIGFFATFYFLRKIYSAIKVD
ncbi:hypothetical protein K450DRAFT_218242 [Umbelopsis ramanniana AG]|uniref:Transmembrane 9 superfamily member n=1 Tax=Umbelopsis ramanniana AG TaxID=1314678 RepID=A0AAD5EJA8_UMBRA|nr:uncharacterized protein K450DRAFT_218242 [Umbelopsis ramanniana AG]KAI8584120.1 hypothetical protein K450DRAFT_218242 [Umbelopsis ramanniana AG]